MRSPYRLWLGAAVAVAGAVFAAPAAANPAAQVADGIYALLWSAVPVFATLAIVVVGYFMLTGRSALESFVTVVIGLLLLAGIGEIVGGASGGSASAIALTILGWLRTGLRAMIVLMLVVVGYMYWSGKGDWQRFVPLLMGFALIELAAFLVSLIGL